MTVTGGPAERRRGRRRLRRRRPRTCPGKAGLGRPLKVFREQEPKLQTLRVAAYTSKLKGVETEGRSYTGIAHPLMEFANELGLGTGNITSYGRTVYADLTDQGGASLKAPSVCRTCWSSRVRTPATSPASVALSSTRTWSAIAIEEYIGRRY
ncbi:nitrate- and nitrite sensing domain-containing protein [Streptomyces thinghirensis]|nr:nitrate- and nitrite sensing domain-containing protein [Streptomyces thinghirensis]